MEVCYIPGAAHNSIVGRTEEVWFLVSRELRTSPGTRTGPGPHVIHELL